MKQNRWFSVVLTVVLLLSVCGCTQRDEPESGFDNTVMGGGWCTYRDGFIYFSDNTRMYEYDTLSGATVDLGHIDDYFAKGLFVMDDKLVYMVSGGKNNATLHYITRDGKESGVLPGTYGAGGVSLDGDNWYFGANKLSDDKSVMHKQFWRRNVETGQEMLLLELEASNGYYLHGEHIYIIEFYTVGNSGDYEKDQDCRLLRSSKDQIVFETMDMNVKPINLVFDGEDMYMSRRGDWRICRYADGKETVLPVASFTYLVFDGHLFYQDATPGNVKPRGNPLKTYNLETEEEKIIVESMFEFAILGNRHVVYSSTLDGSNFRYYVYDWQTGETREMVKPA